MILMRQNLAQNPVLRACGGRFGSAGQGMGAGKGVTREGSSSSYEKGFYNKCWGLVDTPVHKTPCLTIK